MFHYKVGIQTRLQLFLKSDLSCNYCFKGKFAYRLGP
uniref:Uncharacterized protein n=1 Tax=Anguilla anguilla TaxID=7936 RepID=A0A0E9RAG8_ANGAN